MKEHMKRSSPRMPLHSLVVAAVVAVVLATAPARAQVQWKIASAYPSGNFHTENLEAFAQELADTTGGKLLIKIYPNGSLFPAATIMRAVRVGQAEIGEVLISLHEREAPILGIDAVPFLATRRGREALGRIETDHRAEICKSGTARTVRRTLATPGPLLNEADQ
jgi:TRAP-type C4-dicarboxylate transport system substrate-binding protein